MFEINQQCVIEHVNVRRGKNEDSEVAIDIKFSCEEMPGKAVAAALRAASVKEVDDAFFAGASERRFVGLSELPLNCDFEGKHEIRISGMKGMNVSRLWKVKITPRRKGSYDALFQVTVQPDTENFIERIAESLHCSVAVQLKQTQKELWDTEEPEGEQAPVTKTEPKQAALVN